MERAIFRLFNVLATLVQAMAAAFFVTVIVSIVLWPGQARLTAALFCDDTRVSTEVIREFGAGPTGVVDYSLRCTTSDGLVDDVGAARPLLALGVAHTLLLLPLVIVSNRRGWSGSHDPAHDHVHTEHHHHHVEHFD